VVLRFLDAASVCEVDVVWPKAVEAWRSAELRLARVRLEGWDRAAARVPPRRKRGARCKALSMTDGPALGNLVYGEVTLASLWRVLKATRLRKGETFADLGCGAGRQLLGAAALVSGLAGLVGFELMEGYFDAAQAVLRQLPTTKVTLLHEDFTSPAVARTWLDADVVFLTSTCFDDRQMARVAALLRRRDDDPPQKKRPRCVVTLDKPLPDFRIAATVRIDGDWGPATALLHDLFSLTSPPP